MTACEALVQRRSTEKRSPATVYSQLDRHLQPLSSIVLPVLWSRLLSTTLILSSEDTEMPRDYSYRDRDDRERSPPSRRDRDARRDDRGEHRRREGSYRDDDRSRRDRDSYRDRDRLRDEDRYRERDKEDARGRDDDRRRDRDREHDDSRRAGPSRRSASPRARSSQPEARSRSRSAAAEDKAKPNFAPSGLLAAETKTVKRADGTKTVLKYHEPPEARKPSVGWRLYVFKGKEQVGKFHSIHSPLLEINADAHSHGAPDS
ncbi:hypothetical protein ACG7TL_006342 [Trametes sanguinea]